MPKFSWTTVTVSPLLRKNCCPVMPAGGIRSVEVAAYAKGIDIIFVAADRKMTRAEFTAMASRSVREFKGRFGIDRAMPVGAVLDYQKDAASDTRTRFVLKLR